MDNNDVVKGESPLGNLLMQKTLLGNENQHKLSFNKRLNAIESKQNKKNKMNNPPGQITDSEKIERYFDGEDNNNCDVLESQRNLLGGFKSKNIYIERNKNRLYFERNGNTPECFDVCRNNFTPEDSDLNQMNDPLNLNHDKDIIVVKDAEGNNIKNQIQIQEDIVAIQSLPNLDKYNQENSQPSNQLQIPLFQTKSLSRKSTGRKSDSRSAYNNIKVISRGNTGICNKSKDRYSSSNTATKELTNRAEKLWNSKKIPKISIIIKFSLLGIFF